MDDLILIIGCYNRPGEPGLYTYHFNPDTGFSKLLSASNVDNASYFTLNEDKNRLYVISENDLENSAVRAISIDKGTGILGNAETAAAAALTGSPCYVSVRNGIVATANYGGGTLSVVAIGQNGDVKGEISFFTGETGGTDVIRQNVPHMHCAVFSPDGKRLYTSDFSSDRILYFDAENDASSVRPALDEEGRQRCVVVPGETGPRHLVFDATGKHAYLIGELSGAVTVFDIVDNDLVAKQTVIADKEAERASADIRLSPDGRYLYVSHRRRNDGISIFAVDPVSGLLKSVGYKTTGSHPRNFAITPDGKHVLVACRDSNAVEIYRRDADTGLICETVGTISLYRPVCVTVL